MNSCNGFFSNGTKFLLPCLLLILSENEYHGYGILEKIKDFGFYDHDPDISVIYRNLNKLEQNQFVKFRWDTSSAGPAKKVYVITALGLEALEERVEFLKKRRASIDRFIHNYDTRKGQ